MFCDGIDDPAIADAEGIHNQLFYAAAAAGTPTPPLRHSATPPLRQRLIRGNTRTTEGQELSEQMGEPTPDA